MGNRAARLATPCFAAGGTGGGGPVDDGGGGGGGANGGIGHILSFDDGRDGPAAFFGGATIHGVLLPSNQSTLGASSSSVLNADHLSGGSSSSNSFSFRTLDYCASPSSSSGTMTASGVLSRQAARTDEQILADLYATRRRRRYCQKLEETASGSPKKLLDRLRRALASLALPRVGRRTKQQHAMAVTSNGGGAAVESNGSVMGNGGGEEEDEGGRAQWARGEAGEDRVHVVVSSEKEMFVGIYDGFNGPDAADHLVANLYAALNEQTTSLSGDGDHREVLDGMARALRRTEEGYFAAAEARAAECPELGMAGSCVLVVLVRGADVYAMNVGDSRAVLARRAADLPSAGGVREEEIRRQFDGADGELVAMQLTMDHSTNAYKEVRRIRSEHLDDPACIVNGRVKGSLKVTRAFGAGYLKEPRWNDALLEVFRVDYVGSSPYITCRPFLRHHRLRPRDKFLILASDGLFEYFTNEEAVAQVEAFAARYPDEDPAKYLSHEILLRAANQAGMGFGELLEVQHGDDRRRYHDDVSIIIISLDGKIWRS